MQSYHKITPSCTLLNKDPHSTKPCPKPVNYKPLQSPYACNILSEDEEALNAIPRSGLKPLQVPGKRFSWSNPGRRGKRGLFKIQFEAQLLGFQGALNPEPCVRTFSGFGGCFRVATTLTDSNSHDRGADSASNAPSILASSHSKVWVPRISVPHPWTRQWLKSCG